MTSFVTSLKSMVGSRYKGERAAAKAADGVLKRAKSTKDGDGLIEMAKTAGKTGKVLVSSRKTWFSHYKINLALDIVFYCCSVGRGMNGGW